MITRAYPLVTEFKYFENIRMAGLEDIAAMKLNAIIVNGTRLKDFIDIAFLSCHLSLTQMTGAYQQKYSLRNPLVSLKALSYHHDINFSEPVQMVNAGYSWKAIAKRLKEMEWSPSVVFQKPPSV